MAVEEDLSDDAQAGEPDLVARGVGSEDVGNDASQGLGVGADPFLDKTVEGTRRFDHFAGHETPVPRREIRAQDAPQEGSDEGMEAFLRGGVGRQIEGDGETFAGDFTEIREDGGVQGRLVTEVIIHGRDIGAGAPADIADGGVAVTLVRKHLTRSLQQMPSRHRFALCWNPHDSSTSFKHPFKVSNEVGSSRPGAKWG